MGNAALSYINRIETATLSASSDVASMPVTNLATAHRAEKWRSGTGNAVFIDADFGAALEIGVIGIFGSNLTATGQWRLRLSATGIGTGELLDTGLVAAGVVPGYGQALHFPATPIAARWLRVDLSDAAIAAMADGYHEAGILWAGPAFRPERNFDFDAADGWIDPSERSEARGGQLYVDLRDKKRIDGFRLSWLTETEKFEQIMELDRLRGVSGNLLWCRNPGSVYQNRQAICGTLRDFGEIGHPRVGRYGRAFRIEERL